MHNTELNLDQQAAINGGVDIGDLIVTKLSPDKTPQWQDICDAGGSVKRNLKWGEVCDVGTSFKPYV